MGLDFTHPLAVRLRKQIVEAMAGFRMIERDDRVVVCVSGGKDSSILLALLTEIQRRAPYRFHLEAAILDQKQPGFQVGPFRDWVEKVVGVPLTVLERDTYSVVTEKVKNGVYCSLCSRMRRGILYDFAFEKGFTKMALGHHRDDLNQTLLMNLFYTGKISSMPPKLRSDDGRNVIIRPLALVAESDLIGLAADWKFPVIPCNLCGSQDGMKRQRVKALIRDLEKEIPHLSHSLAAAQSNVHESQLLDHRLWDFDRFESRVEASPADEVTGEAIGTSAPLGTQYGH